MKFISLLNNAVPTNDEGFSIIELLISLIIFPLLLIGIVSAYNSARHVYTTTRQLNEMYTVLSSCPELDRGLEFNSLSSTNNCYPNNTFPTEDGGNATVTYAPSLTVTDTSNLPASDSLKAIPDSKVVDVSVGWPAPSTSLPPIKLRILITRNGIGQQ
jgi:hypothetical protein